MSEKSLKMPIEIPGRKLVDSTTLLNEMKKKISSYLMEQNNNISESIVNNSCKNALYLTRSKKKAETKSLTVYIPRSGINSSSASSPKSPSSVDINDTDNDEQEHLSPKNDIEQQVPQLKFEYTDEKGLMMYTNFVYMRDSFSELLNRSSKSINISNFINEICCD